MSFWISKVSEMHLIYLFTIFSILRVGGEDNSDDRPARYVLYDVNPGEGFNLRRDVYMRMAVFVR